jgi:hypothetical protein
LKESDMSTQIMLAHHDVVSINRLHVHSDTKSRAVVPLVTSRPKRSALAITGEDIPSLITFVPVGLLGLISLGSVLSAV